MLAMQWISQMCPRIQWPIIRPAFGTGMFPVSRASNRTDSSVLLLISETKYWRYTESLGSKMSMS